MVTNLIERYEELVALHLAEQVRLRERLLQQGRVILAIDGLQPDVGHEVLWVLRDCLSGEVLLARSLLSSTEDDLAALIEQVKRDLALVGQGKRAKATKGAEPREVPIVGAVSDGQHSVRNAVARALPGVPHQLCQFHYLREAISAGLRDGPARQERTEEARAPRPPHRAAGGGRGGARG